MSKQGADKSKRPQAGYALGLLGTTTFFYQLDRNAIYVTQELIKIEFGLTDTQLGVLTGVAYGVANGLLGLPLGWLIDRVVRKNFLGAIVTLWSVLTALCGLTTSYFQFLLARVGVGAAESGGTPTSLSLISDLYPPEQRSSRLAWMSTGYSIGTLVSFLLGGFLAAQFGWRAVFLCFGIPGGVLGLLILFTMREPSRRDAQAQSAPSIREFFPTAWSLVRRPGLRLLYLGVVLNSINAAGVFSWWASFMMRIHGLSVEIVGLIGTIVLGLAGIAGMISAGFLADRARSRRLGGPLYLLAAVALVCFSASTVAIWTSSVPLMIVALFFAGGTVGIYIGPGNAVISEIAPANARGMAFAIPVIITNLVGVTIGPLLVGYLSDLAASFGTRVEPLRLAMFTVSLLQIIVIIIYLRAGRWRDRTGLPQDRDLQII